MKILIVEPGKDPRAADIAPTLEAMQQVVGGYIEVVCPWADSVAIVCDEEGVLNGKPINRDIGNGLVIVGTFFLCGLGEEDLCGLTAKQAEKYSKLLAQQ